MARLLIGESEVVLVSQLELAKSFASRLRGLVGIQKISDDFGLFFPRCNSIHSLGMRTAFDLIFVDEAMIVTELHPEVRPGRMVRSKKGVHCLELAPGKIASAAVKIGEKLKIE